MVAQRRRGSRTLWRATTVLLLVAAYCMSLALPLAAATLSGDSLLENALPDPDMRALTCDAPLRLTSLEVIHDQTWPVVCAPGTVVIVERLTFAPGATLTVASPEHWPDLQDVECGGRTFMGQDGRSGIDITFIAQIIIGTGIIQAASGAPGQSVHVTGCTGEQVTVHGGDGGAAGSVTIISPDADQLTVLPGHAGDGGDAHGDAYCPQEGGATCETHRGRRGGEIAPDGGDINATGDDGGHHALNGTAGTTIIAYGGHAGIGPGGRGGHATAIGGNGLDGIYDPDQWAAGSGHGGRGGNAFAQAGNASNGQPGGDGGHALAIAGDGGHGGDVENLQAKFEIHAGNGGDGGQAVAYGGSSGTHVDGNGIDGGNATVHNGHSGRGGHALAPLGYGGDGGSGAGTAYGLGGNGGHAPTGKGGAGGDVWGYDGNGGDGGNGVAFYGKGGPGGGVDVKGGKAGTGFDGGDGGGGGAYGGRAGDAGKFLSLPAPEPTEDTPLPIAVMLAGLMVAYWVRARRRV